MSYKNTSRSIAAFSMADYESLTGHAEFGRGKDKTTRKKRGLLDKVGIGLGAAGVGSGVGLTANRYLQPALQYRKAQKNFDAKGVLASTGGAKGQLSRDVEAVKGLGSRAVRTGVSGLAYGKAAIQDPKAAAAFLGQKVRNVGTNAAMLGRDGFSKIGASKLALGVGGAATLGAATLGAYKLLQNRKKKKAK